MLMIHMQNYVIRNNVGTKINVSVMERIDWKRNMW